MENGVYIQHIAKFDSAVLKPTLQIIKKRPLKLTNFVLHYIPTNYCLVPKQFRHHSEWLRAG